MHHGLTRAVHFRFRAARKPDTVPVIMTKPRLLCIGSCALDRTWTAESRILAHASNPGHMESSAGGVAFNVAADAANLGCSVSLAALFGADPDGTWLRGECMRRGLDISPSSTLPDRATASYLAVLDPEGDLYVGVAAMGIVDAFTADRLPDTLPAADAAFIEANLPEATIGALLDRLTPLMPVYGGTVSPAKARRLKPHLSRFTGLFMNKTEAEILCDRSLDTADALIGAVRGFADLGAEASFITLAENGVAIRVGILPAFPVTPRDVVGGGDAFAAGALWALMRGLDHRAAARAGLACGSLAVETEGRGWDALSPQAVEARLAAHP